MGDNIYRISDSNDLERVFSSANDKLIILMFCTKHNVECRRALQYFEKIAANHITSIFCVIDMDKFQGESRIVSSSLSSPMPKFDCYYNGNPLTSQSISNYSEIEQMVKLAEQHIITQKNGNVNMINQQMLNQAQMMNPNQFQNLNANPLLFQQMMQKIYLIHCNNI